MKHRKVVSVSEVLILFFGGQFGIWTDYCFREARFHKFADHVLAAALVFTLLVALSVRPHTRLERTPALSTSQALCFRFLGTFALGFTAAFCLNYPPGHRYDTAGVLLSTMLTTIVVMVVAATAFGIRYERR
jgi:FtsH-binding integral membrane protein